MTKEQSITISDKEHTLLDALHQPQYAGGSPEVAKALWISRTDIKVARLLDYMRALFERPCAAASNSCWNFTEWLHRSSSNRYVQS